MNLTPHEKVILLIVLEKELETARKNKSYFLDTLNRIKRKVNALPVVEEQNEQRQY